MMVHLVSTVTCVITILLFVVVNFSGVTSSPGKFNFILSDVDVNENTYCLHYELHNGPCHPVQLKRCDRVQIRKTIEFFHNSRLIR